MASIKHIKIALLGVFTLLLFVWIGSGSYLAVAGVEVSSAPAEEPAGATVPAPTPEPNSADYVGSETCRGCHEAQFDSVAGTKHGKLHTISSWKDKVVGCEACHGPGREHVEGGGDVTKIVRFKDLDPKAASETCLSCHAGKENHNNYRRGDHWRNNVSCNDCHTAHGPDHPGMKPDSITFVGDAASNKPVRATTAMLRQNEPQLCMTCHNETRAQFMKPFHHKVLEGTMTCSDCHNPHGGFEQKQTRLAVGADASCIRCHANKQGPFVFEHAPLKLEGCASCHQPHGSANPKMLKRPQVRQMCFECHTGITDEVSPQAPSLHNQASVRYTQCTVCHSMIHGSNSSRYFFR